MVRFRNPQQGSVIFDDHIRGRIEFSNQELDDLIIARSDGTPTYNFCVVVDDWDMGITHVVRGEDHINNTPRQINILKSARCTGTRIRTRVDDLGRRRQEIVQTPRCRQRDAVS